MLYEKQCGVCHTLHGEEHSFCKACYPRVARGEVCMKCVLCRDIVWKKDGEDWIFYRCKRKNHPWFVCKKCDLRSEGNHCKKCFQRPLFLRKVENKPQ